MTNVCKHCGERNCYLHCQDADDGKHVPDPSSAHSADGATLKQFIIDVNCINCGQSGSTLIEPSSIQWE